MRAVSANVNDTDLTIEMDVRPTNDVAALEVTFRDARTKQVIQTFLTDPHGESPVMRLRVLPPRSDVRRFAIGRGGTHVLAGDQLSMTYEGADGTEPGRAGNVARRPLAVARLGRTKWHVVLTGPVTAVRFAWEQARWLLVDMADSPTRDLSTSW